MGDELGAVLAYAHLTGARLSGDSGVIVTYTVRGQSVPPTTTVPSAATPTPAVTHQPLPLTGAPVALELIGSFGLLAAGALTALSARRRATRAGRRRGA